MSETFEKILVKDDRLGCISSKVKYQVLKGGQNVTCQAFNAISQSTTNHVYNIAVPTLETIISREVLWKSTITLKISVSDRQTGTYPVNYGVTDALAPFPLHSLVNVMSATINNNTVSLNVQETLPLLLRMVDPEELAKYNCMTPTSLDFLADYMDAIQRMDWHIDKNESASNPGTPTIYYAGDVESDPVTGSVAYGTRPVTYHSFANNILAYDMNRPAGTSYYHKPRGSWLIKQIYAINDTGGKVIPRITDRDVYVKFEVTEPLLLSPFIFGSGYGKQGFYGIASMTFQMVMNGGSANRAWRSAADYTSLDVRKTATVASYEDSQLIFQFLTPHSSDMLDPRNVVPYYEIPIYKTTGFQDLPGRTNRGRSDDNGSFPSPESRILYSSSIQLTCIPDKIVVCVRKNIGNLTCEDADSYATIKNISINFNNQAGLLSSMTPEQLYRNSVQSGLANMSWDEFCGSVISCSGVNAGGTRPHPAGPYQGVGANQEYGGKDNAGVQYVPTTGTILVLNFAEVIQLTEEFYAPGSLGSFNLQLQVTVQNNQSYTWRGNEYELVIMVMNSGVFVNERGTSSTFIGLLTKQDVLDALQQQPYSSNEVRRMVGGGFLDNIRSGLGWITSKLPAVRGVLEHVPHQYAQTGANVLKALGYGKGQRPIDNRLA